VNFSERIKKRMMDIRNSAGMGHEIRVDARDLLRLVEDYERLDAYARDIHVQENRGAYTPEMSVEKSVVNLYFQSNRDPFKIIKLVVDVLSNLHRGQEKLDATVTRAWGGRI